MAKSTTDETSERKRISIPKADESVLAWWDEQKDPGLSVRLLIRSEIERGGYTDTAYRPVAQLPRRGRPPVDVADAGEITEGTTGSTGSGGVTHPVATSVVTPAPVTVTTQPAPEPVAAAVAAQPAQPAGFSHLDDLMNG